MANPTTASIAVSDQAGARQLLAVEVGSELVPVWHSSISTDLAGVPTYRASASFTPFATAPVCFVSIQGSATKTIRIKKILLGLITTTAASQQVFQLKRCTGLGTGGTVVTVSAGLMDGNFAAATAVVKHFTAAAQTSGTGAGGPMTTANVQACVRTTPIAAGSQNDFFLFPECGVLTGSAIVLRGTSDFLEVQNLTPANLTANTDCHYTIEWTEDAS